MEDSIEQQCNEEGICTIPPDPTSSTIESNTGATVTEQISSQEMDTDSTCVTAPPPTKSKSNRRKKEKSPSVKSSILTLHGQQDLDALISTNNNVIVEFMTSWCTACQGIEEYYEELSSSISSHSHQDDSLVQAARVLCDKNKQTKKLSALYNVKSYPVFIVFEDGNVASRWDGADRGKLESAFERLADGGGGGGHKKKHGKGRNSRR